MKRFYCSIIIILAMFLLPLSSSAADAKKDAWNPKKCPALSKKEAGDILQKLKDAQAAPPNAQVTDVKHSPVEGLWQVEIQVDANKAAFFVDCAKKHLVMQIVPIDTIRPRLVKADISKVPLDEAVVLGAADAAKKVVVFSDPDCPACKQLHGVMKQIIEKRKDIAFSIMMYPLPMHGKDAYQKAQAILCERSVSVLDDAYTGKPVPEPKCSNEQLEKSIASGKALPIEGTPTMIRADGMIFNGPRDPDTVIKWIDGK